MKKNNKSNIKYNHFTKLYINLKKELELSKYDNDFIENEIYFIKRNIVGCNSILKCLETLSFPLIISIITIYFSFIKKFSLNKTILLIFIFYVTSIIMIYICNLLILKNKMILELFEKYKNSKEC